MSDENGDYSVDKVPVPPTQLKGNSAEGNPIKMDGFGKYADFARPVGEDGMHINEGKDAMGAFIQGH